MQDQSAFPGGYQPLPPPPPAIAHPAISQAAAPVVPTVDHGWLRELASRQRWAIVAGIANGVGGVLVYENAFPEGVGDLLALGVGIFVIVAAFRLANHLYNVGLGIVCAAAMIVPLVWIGVLAVLCVKGSRKLRGAGMRVGFFGANPDGI